MSGRGTGGANRDGVMTATADTATTQPGRAFYLTIFVGLATGMLIVALVEVLDVCSAFERGCN
jgi:hypothetical protein